MLTRRLIAIPIALAATCALATAVLAGGWATVAITDPPADPPAGRETRLDLTVLQHGVSPVSWPVITVIARDAASGATVAGQATASGPAGHYAVGLTFPSAGTWTLTFVSQDLVMQGTGTLAVGPVAAPALSTTPSDNGTPDVPMTVALLAIVALFLVSFAAMVVHDRRQDRRAQRHEIPTAPSAGA